MTAGRDHTHAKIGECPYCHRNLTANHRCRARDAALGGPPMTNPSGECLCRRPKVIRDAIGHSARCEEYRRNMTATPPTPPQPFGEEREMVAKGAAFVPIGNMRALLAALDAANKATADLETVCQLQLTQIRKSATALAEKTAEVERLTQREQRTVAEYARDHKALFEDYATERDRAAEYAEQNHLIGAHLKGCRRILTHIRDAKPMNGIEMFQWAQEMASVAIEQSDEVAASLDANPPDGTSARARVKALETFLLWIRNEYNASPYPQSQIDSVLEPSS